MRAYELIGYEPDRDYAFVARIFRDVIAREMVETGQRLRILELSSHSRRDLIDPEVIPPGDSDL